MAIGQQSTLQIYDYLLMLKLLYTFFLQGADRAVIREAFRHQSLSVVQIIEGELAQSRPYETDASELWAIPLENGSAVNQHNWNKRALASSIVVGPFVDSIFVF